MAASEPQKQAYEKYAATPEGTEARREAVRRYQDTEQGKQKLKEAQERLEATEKRKEYRRKWDRDNRARLRREKLNASKSDS